MNSNTFSVNAWLLAHRSPFGRISLTPQIKCRDGFKVSVQASSGHYCAPRNDVGPWTEVEVGYPSQASDLIAEYAENPGALTDTVYPCVPVEVVEALIESHGGADQVAWRGERRDTRAARRTLRRPPRDFP